MAVGLTLFGSECLHLGFEADALQTDFASQLPLKLLLGHQPRSLGLHQFRPGLALLALQHQLKFDLLVLYMA
jgi:hypothetical protein